MGQVATCPQISLAKFRTIFLADEIQRIVWNHERFMSQWGNTSSMVKILKSYVTQITPLVSLNTMINIQIYLCKSVYLYNNVKMFYMN